jgi:hypothetical protein
LKRKKGSLEAGIGFCGGSAGSREFGGRGDGREIERKGKDVLGRELGGEMDKEENSLSSGNHQEDCGLEILRSTGKRVAL